LSREQIRDVFAQSDLFVQPSVKEAFGLAALEARTSGLPVLVRSESGSTEFVRQGIEGFVVASDAEMVEILTRLARDPSPLDEIRSHNTTVRPDTTWPSILSRLTHAYSRAVVTARRVRG
jgi:glycosyltransferase involved in cell wall biosynthesis